MDTQEITRLIESGMPGGKVQVTSPDNTHFEAIVISDAFEGKRAIARHQMIYQCLGKLMGNEIHAMSIRAHTSAEWQDLTSSGQS